MHYGRGGNKSTLLPPSVNSSKPFILMTSVSLDLKHVLEHFAEAGDAAVTSFQISTAIANTFYDQMDLAALPFSPPSSVLFLFTSSLSPFLFLALPPSLPCELCANHTLDSRTSPQFHFKEQQFPPCLREDPSARPAYLQHSLLGKKKQEERGRGDRKKGRKGCEELWRGKKGKIRKEKKTDV